MSDNVVELDVRRTPVFQRNPLIFEAWDELEPGSTLQLVNDHDPKLIRHQLESGYGGVFEWEYVTEGPTEWRVNITKIRYVGSSGEELAEKVRNAIEEVRPHLQADGGDVELVEIDDEDKIVKVRLTGACGGCPSAQMTLKSGVEATIRKYAPEIRGVEEAGQ